MTDLAAGAAGAPGSDPRGRIFITADAFTDMARWHEVAAELRRDDPVARVEAEGWAPFWAITRHADVFEVSRRSDLFWNTPRSAPGPEVQYEALEGMGIEPRTLVHLHGQEHDAYRKVTNDWFKPAAVRHLQPDIDAIANEFVDHLADLGGECDLAQDLAVPFTIRVIMSIFGVPEHDEDLMLQLTQGLFGAADPEYLGDATDPFQLVIDTVQRFTDYFNQLTSERRAEPGEDLATVLATGEVDGRPLGESELLWYYIIIATAGHDTTSFALSGGMEELLRHPDQVQALRDDPELVGPAAEEMIRWTSPVRSFMRWVQEDTVLGGQELAAGDQVLTSYPSANRDHAVFDDPMAFDVRRPDADEHLAFGLGMHHCLGAQVARRELRTMLAKLLERTTSIELAGEPEWSSAHFVSGVKHLPVRYQLA